VTFLVADDSKLARAKIIDFLETLGHAVIGEAVDGIDAIERYRELSPTCVTIDLEMPRMNGIDAACEILRVHPKAIILLITSMRDKKELLKATDIGIYATVHKPITLETLSQICIKIEKERPQ